MRYLLEIVLRPFLRAPYVDVDHAVDNELTGACIGLTGTQMTVIGVEAGQQVMVGRIVAHAVEADESAMSPHLAALVSLDGARVRRRIFPLIVKEMWALTWTLVGMFTVLITLEGDAQTLATLSVGLGLLLHTLTLRLPKLPKASTRRPK